MPDLRIGFASMDWSLLLDSNGHPTPGGSGWYRCHLPHRALLDAGVDSVIGRLVADLNTGRLGVREWDDTDHFDRDVIVLQRWMLDGLADDIIQARTTGQLVLQDIDDWFFGLATQNRASQFLNSDPRSNLAHYRRILIASDLVVTSTPYLARRLGSFLPRCVLSRNRIDLDTAGRWWPTTPQRDHPILGWVGAVPWRSGDLETLRGIIAPLVARLGVPFHHSGHIGGDYETAGTILGIPGGSCTSSSMAPIADWPAQFAHFDVGIIPLSDRPFNLAKSAIKGMEYVAAGKPFVAQATPEYSWLASQGVGRVARRPRDWTRHLDELLSMTAGERTAEADRNQAALRSAGLTTATLAETWLEVVCGALDSLTSSGTFRR